MAIKEIRLGAEQDKPDDNIGKSPLDKITEEVKVLQKQQELEALKAGFKDTGEYRKALEQLANDRSKFGEWQVKEESMLQTRELSVIQREDEVNKKAAQNKSEAQHIIQVGKEYQEKWATEDLEKQQIIKDCVTQLKEAVVVTNGLHPRYLTDIARGKILVFVNRALQQFGVTVNSPLIDDNSDNNGDIISNITQAYDICIVLYNYLQKEQKYGIGFSRWLYPLLKSFNNMLTLQTVNSDNIYTDKLLTYVKAINIGVLHLAEKYEADKNNKVDYSEISNYLCQVSNRIEQLCGVTVNAR